VDLINLLPTKVITTTAINDGDLNMTWVILAFLVLFSMYLIGWYYYVYYGPGHCQCGVSEVEPSKTCYSSDSTCMSFCSSFCLSINPSNGNWKHSNRWCFTPQLLTQLVVGLLLLLGLITIIVMYWSVWNEWCTVYEPISNGWYMGPGFYSFGLCCGFLEHRINHSYVTSMVWAQNHPSLISASGDIIIGEFLSHHATHTIWSAAILPHLTPIAPAFRYGFYSGVGLATWLEWTQRL
jgi:hypothetical protein